MNESKEKQNEKDEKEVMLTQISINDIKKIIAKYRTRPLGRVAFDSNDQKENQVHDNNVPAYRRPRRPNLPIDNDDEFFDAPDDFLTPNDSQITEDESTDDDGNESDRSTTTVIRTPAVGDTRRGPPPPPRPSLPNHGHDLYRALDNLRREIRNTEAQRNISERNSVRFNENRLDQLISRIPNQIHIPAPVLPTNVVLNDQLSQEIQSQLDNISRRLASIPSKFDTSVLENKIAELTAKVESTSRPTSTFQSLNMPASNSLPTFGQPSSTLNSIFGPPSNVDRISPELTEKLNEISARVSALADNRANNEKFNSMQNQINSSLDNIRAAIQRIPPPSVPTDPNDVANQISTNIRTSIDGLNSRLDAVVKAITATAQKAKTPTAPPNITVNGLEDTVSRLERIESELRIVANRPSPTIPPPIVQVNSLEDVQNSLRSITTKIEALETKVEPQTPSNDGQINNMINNLSDQLTDVSNKFNEYINAAPQRIRSRQELPARRQTIFKRRESTPAPSIAPATQDLNVSELVDDIADYVTPKGPSATRPSTLLSDNAIATMSDNIAADLTCPICTEYYSNRMVKLRIWNYQRRDFDEKMVSQAAYRTRPCNHLMHISCYEKAVDENLNNRIPNPNACPICRGPVSSTNIDEAITKRSMEESQAPGLALAKQVRDQISGPMSLETPTIDKNAIKQVIKRRLNIMATVNEQVEEYESVYEKLTKLVENIMTEQFLIAEGEQGVVQTDIVSAIGEISDEARTMYLQAREIDPSPMTCLEHVLVLIGQKIDSLNRQYNNAGMGEDEPDLNESQSFLDAADQTLSTINADEFEDEISTTEYAAGELTRRMIGRLGQMINKKFLQCDQCLDTEASSILGCRHTACRDCLISREGDCRLCGSRNNTSLNVIDPLTNVDENALRQIALNLENTQKEFIGLKDILTAQYQYIRDTFGEAVRAAPTTGSAATSRSQNITQRLTTIQEYLEDRVPNIMENSGKSIIAKIANVLTSQQTLVSQKIDAIVPSLTTQMTVASQRAANPRSGEPAAQPNITAVRNDIAAYLRSSDFTEQIVQQINTNVTQSIGLNLTNLDSRIGNALTDFGRTLGEQLSTTVTQNNSYYQITEALFKFENFLNTINTRGLDPNVVASTVDTITELNSVISRISDMYDTGFNNVNALLDGIRTNVQTPIASIIGDNNTFNRQDITELQYTMRASLESMASARTADIESITTSISEILTRQEQQLQKYVEDIARGLSIVGGTAPRIGPDGREIVPVNIDDVKTSLNEMATSIQSADQKKAQTILKELNAMETRITDSNKKCVELIKAVSTGNTMPNTGNTTSAEIQTLINNHNVKMEKHLQDLVSKQNALNEQFQKRFMKHNTRLDLMSQAVSDLKNQIPNTIASNGNNPSSTLGSIINPIVINDIEQKLPPRAANQVKEMFENMKPEDFIRNELHTHDIAKLGIPLVQDNIKAPAIREAPEPQRSQLTDTRPNQLPPPGDYNEFVNDLQNNRTISSTPHPLIESVASNRPVAATQEEINRITDEISILQSTWVKTLYRNTITKLNVAKRATSNMNYNQLVNAVKFIMDDLEAVITIVGEEHLDVILANIPGREATLDLIQFYESIARTGGISNWQTVNKINGDITGIQSTQPAINQMGNYQPKKIIPTGDKPLTKIDFTRIKEKNRINLQGPTIEPSVIRQTDELAIKQELINEHAIDQNQAAEQSYENGDESMEIEEIFRKMDKKKLKQEYTNHYAAMLGELPTRGSYFNLKNAVDVKKKLNLLKDFMLKDKVLRDQKTPDALNNSMEDDAIDQEASFTMKHFDKNRQEYERIRDELQNNLDSTVRPNKLKNKLAETKKDGRKNTIAPHQEKARKKKPQEVIPQIPDSDDEKKGKGVPSPRYLMGHLVHAGGPATLQHFREQNEINKHHKDFRKKAFTTLSDFKKKLPEHNLHKIHHMVESSIEQKPKHELKGEGLVCAHCGKTNEEKYHKSKSGTIMHRGCFEGKGMTPDRKLYEEDYGDDIDENGPYQNLYNKHNAYLTAQKQGTLSYPTIYERFKKSIPTEIKPKLKKIVGVARHSLIFNGSMSENRLDEFIYLLGYISAGIDHRSSIPENIVANMEVAANKILLKYKPNEKANINISDLDFSNFENLKKQIKENPAILYELDFQK